MSAKTNGNATYKAVATTTVELPRRGRQRKGLEIGLIGKPVTENGVLRRMDVSDFTEADRERLDGFARQNGVLPIECYATGINTKLIDQRRMSQKVDVPEALVQSGMVGAEMAPAAATYIERLARMFNVDTKNMLAAMELSFAKQ